MTITYLSFFAGIEGLNFDVYGMKCLAHVELDPNARSILKRHYPDVPQYEDIRHVGKHNLPTVDLICGGFPCQDVSTAGRRAGLAGEQSGLWFEFHRVLVELKATWVVIENVPGLLSSNGGRDFAVVLGGLTGSIPQVPDGGWRNAGVARGHPDLWKVAWRMLDAQYLGVPQRRRRVFIVGHLGDGRAAQVLFERESSGWYSASRRKARQGTTASVKASAPNRRNGGSDPTADEFVVSIKRQGGYGYTITEDIDSTLEAHETNMPMVVDTTHITSPQNGSNPRPGDPSPTLTAHAHVPLLVGTLGAANGRNRGLGQENETDMLIVDEHQMFRKNGFGSYSEDTTAQILAAHEAKEPSNIIAFKWSASSTADQIVRPNGIAGPVLASRNGMDAISSPFYGVRRLTPTECERLQGFPDGYTEFGADGKRMSDTTRYYKLGNAVCRAHTRWLAERIMKQVE